MIAITVTANNDFVCIMSLNAPNFLCGKYYLFDRGGN